MSKPTEEPPARQEWKKVVHRPGGTFVTVTIREGAYSAKWTAKTYATHIPAGYLEARTHAERVLAELKDCDAAWLETQERAA